MAGNLANGACRSNFAFWNLDIEVKTIGWTDLIGCVSVLAQTPKCVTLSIIHTQLPESGIWDHGGTLISLIGLILCPTPNEHPEYRFPDS